MSRTLDPKVPQTNWFLLLQSAISLASARKDPRLLVLQKAYREGQAEACLRRFGILSEVDLTREFPTP